MKSKMINISFSKIAKTLCFVLFSMFLATSSSATSDEEYLKYYKDLTKVTVQPEIEKLAPVASSEAFGVNASFILNNLAKMANGEKYNTVGILKENEISAKEFSPYAYANRSIGTYEAIGSDAGRMITSLQNQLLELQKQNRLTGEQAQLIMNEAVRLVSIGSTRANEAAVRAKDNLSDTDRITTGASFAVSADRTQVSALCSTTSHLRAKYQSGCWSCLVVEKLSSAFLTAAKTAYSLSQRAGITLLWIGTIFWLLIWALKNVSSFAQVEPGNILNELIKFCFKVSLAYWFIIGGLTMVREYFISPIMGAGAVIGEQFWSDQIVDYVDSYIWEDEVVTPQQEKEITENIAKHNQEKLKAAGVKTEKLSAEPTEAKNEAYIEPEAIQYDSVEAIVQDIQKAFIAVLQKQLGEIKGSCVNGGCGSACRFSSCTDRGHMSYVAKIHATAKSGFGGNVAYCQAAITAAMNQVNEQIGGNAADVLQKVGAGCAMGLTNASKYKDGFSAASAGGGNVTLCVNGQMPGNLKLNVGDTVYYNKVTTKAGSGQKMGATSGYHAVTYIGGGNTISFNGDAQGSMCNSFYYNVQGRVACVSCMLRQKLKDNPSIVNKINKAQLSKMAAGYDITLRNFSGGVYSSAPASADDSSLIIAIEDIKYSGPTDIMPKSVMNSILGATKAITNITAENMILGDAIMCYSTLERGGAWKLFDGWWMPSIYITNATMWLGGFIIFCMGILLTMAIIYYLMDMSFRIGFAVIALPIVVGLWPFNMTKGKFSACVSIIAKAAATFAFLALITTYTVELTNAVISFGDSAEDVAKGEGGIAKLYTIMDEAGNIDNANKDGDEDNMEYAANKLALFSTTFVLLLFAFLYSFKLVQGTVPEVVNKFFPDKMLGETNPMHQWATAATKWAKDQAMKPAGYARDIALNKAGEGLKGMAGKLVGMARGGGKGGGAASSTMKGAAQAGKAAGTAVEGAGKAVQGAGKGIGAVSQAANVVPVVGQAVAATGKAAGAAVEAAGKGVEAAGKGIKKTSEAVEKGADAVGKAEDAVKKTVGQGGDKNDQQKKEEKPNPIKDNKNILG